MPSQPSPIQSSNGSRGGEKISWSLVQRGLSTYEEHDTTPALPPEHELTVPVTKLTDAELAARLKNLDRQIAHLAALDHRPVRVYEAMVCRRAELLAERCFRRSAYLRG